ncbi:MAG: hypothetical protein RLZZ157_17 [Pseudomonadota bacterium]|jgi:hypothetical protein
MTMAPNIDCKELAVIHNGLCGLNEASMWSLRQVQACTVTMTCEALKELPNPYLGWIATRTEVSLFESKSAHDTKLAINDIISGEGWNGQSKSFRIWRGRGTLNLTTYCFEENPANLNVLASPLVVKGAGAAKNLPVKYQILFADKEGDGAIRRIGAAFVGFE